MSKLEPKLNYIITPELYEQFAEKSRRPDKTVTVRLLLLQLGYTPENMTVSINGQTVSDFENTLIEPMQSLNIVATSQGGRGIVTTNQDGRGIKK